MSGGLVVVATATHGVSRPTRDQQYHADDEQDDPDDEQEMGEGEGRDEAGEDESQDDEDDSENDHDVYLVSMVVQKYMGSGGQCLKTSLTFAPACLALPLA
jgi:hypothetical protein